MSRTAFTATFARQIDGQGRMQLPVPWRGAGETFSLHLATTPAPHVLVTASGDGTAPDSVGRLRIPDDLRQAAGIETEALLVGLIDRFAVWSPAAFQTIAQAGTKHTVGTLV